MDLMLTTKTLGRNPGCVVMSMAAAVFDPHNPKSNVHDHPSHQFYTAISTFDSASHRLHTDEDTLKWWKKQVAWPSIGEEFINSNVSVELACRGFQDFCQKHKPEKIWSNSPTFHVRILEALFHKTGLSFPFDYRKEMDFRTALDLAHQNRDERPSPNEKRGYYPHHALGDCLDQCDALVSALQRLKSNSPSFKGQRWLMLDIETLGRRPGDGIVSIGASLFSPSNDPKVISDPKNHFYRVLNTFDLSNNGFSTEPETLKWWKERDIWKTLSSQFMNSTATVKSVCEDLSKFIENQSNPDKIWSNSPSFDVEMTRHMFQKVGVPFPMSYQKEMDFRTLMELAYPNREKRPRRIFEAFDQQHHALGDAMEQAFQTSLALKNFTGLAIQPATPSLQKKLVGLIERLDESQKDLNNASKAIAYLDTKSALSDRKAKP